MAFDRPPVPGLDRLTLPQAEYALLGWQDGTLSVEFRRVLSDLDLLLRAVFDSGMPHADWWATNWAHTP